MKHAAQVGQIGILIVGLIIASVGLSQNGNFAHVSAAPQETVINLSGERILYSSLATADFNGDGYKEIVAAGQDGMLYVISSSDGVNWDTVWSRQCNDDILAANPPTLKSTNKIESSPAIADLDGDGHLDIVIALGGDVHHPDLGQHANGGVLVYRFNNAWDFALIEPLSANGTRGWPQPRIDQVGWPPPGYSDADGFWDGIVPTPALGDLDGDGDLEIVLGHIDRRIHAWHHTGEVVAGWPIYRDNGDALLRGSYLSSPALGDIDDDGLPEVVVGTMSPPWGGPGSPNPDYSKGTVWAINGDSTNVPGFPVETEQYIFSSPALGDIDNDGALEIVVGAGWGTTGRQNLVYAWNHDGTLMPNWPQETAGVTSAPPALGDLDHDGDLEIVVGCGSHVDDSCRKLYAWEVDGSLVAGFPAEPLSPNPWITGSYFMPYNPILADFDGDGTVEILIVHQGAWGITVVEPNGVTSDHTGRPFPNALFAPPLVDDVDNDGLLEILAGGADETVGNAAIRMWDENGSVSSALPWPMFRRNVSRTGRFQLPPQLGFPSELRFLHQQGTLEIVSQSAMVRNLGEGAYDWEITNPIAGLQVDPITGTVTTEMDVQFRLDVTSHSANVNVWQDLGDLMVSGRVNGQHVESSPLTVPVWLYTGDLSLIYLPVVLQRF